MTASLAKSPMRMSCTLLLGDYFKRTGLIPTYMSKIGIDSLGIYVPKTYVSLQELAKRRGVDPEKFTQGLGQESFAVPLSNEDTVTLAANALENLLGNSDLELKDIGRLVVATETPVDHAKTVANYISGLFDLPKDCELYEVKHSCIAGTYALFDAINWIRSGQHRGKKAVVICSDIARYKLRSRAEPTHGAGAVALLVSEEARLLSIDSVTGTATEDAADFWKPVNSDATMVDGQLSVECYLKGLREAFMDYEEKGGDTHFDYVAFHTPFCKMAKKAFETLAVSLPSLKDRFDEAIAPSLHFAKRVGNTYTASLYLALASLLTHGGSHAIGKSVGLFSFGSGYSARFFRGNIEGGISGIPAQPSQKLSVETYEMLRQGTLSLKEEKGFVLEEIDERGYRFYQRKRF